VQDSVEDGEEVRGDSLGEVARAIRPDPGVEASPSGSVQTEDGALVARRLDADGRQ
jgi:hypothetical protein